MSIKLKSVVTTFVLAFMSEAVGASGAVWFNDLKPYVGADAAIRRMNFKGGFGDNLLQHHSPQGNLYAGLKLTPSTALELGFEATTTRTRTVTLTTGDLCLGANIPAAMSPAVFKSKQKIKGPHLDLVGYYSFIEGTPIQLLGSAGLAAIKGTFERKTISANGMSGNTRKLKNHKVVLRLAGGLEYSVNDSLGARATVGWINTSRMQIASKDDFSTSVRPTVKPKNSMTFGLGLNWKF